jgi:hypothetical protein
MWIVLNGSKDGKPLLGHAASVGMQGGSPRFLVCRVICHTPIEALIMSASQ